MSTTGWATEDRCSETGSIPKPNHNLTTRSQEQHLEEARAAPVLSQGLKWEEVGKLWGRGEDQHDQEAPSHLCRGMHPPKSQMHLAGQSHAQLLQGTGSAVLHKICLAPRIWWVSSYHVCQQHVPGDLPLTTERHWEKVLVGRRGDQQGLYQHQKPMSRPSSTWLRAGGGDETEPSLNNHPVISVQSAEGRAHPTPLFPALQGLYEKGGRGGTWDLQKSEGQHKGISVGKDRAPVLPLRAKVCVPLSAQQPSAKGGQIQAPAAVQE